MTCTMTRTLAALQIAVTLRIAVVLRIAVTLLIAVALPLPLQADPPPAAGLGPPLSAAEFDAYATGKTLSYAQYGVIWGTEQYLPNRQVLWAPSQSSCEYGTWEEQDGAICFTYEASPGPNCWLFYRGPIGLLAQFVGGGTLLSEVDRSPAPLSCPGPLIGA